MSEQDQAAKGDLEAEAAKLLPCHGCQHWDYSDHHPTCPAYFRPAVTAWVRKRDEQWQKDCDALSALVDKYGTRSDELAEELARLRQENHDLRNKLQDELGARQLAEAERDAAYNKALNQAAKAMCDECRMDHHADEASCLALPIRAMKIKP